VIDITEQQEDKQLEEVVFDHLHSVAFQVQPLGRTILGPKNHILSIKQTPVSYIKNEYTADRMVLVGTGGVEHQEAGKLAEKHFSSLPVSPILFAWAVKHTLKPVLLAQKSAYATTKIPTANIAIAVEGVGLEFSRLFPHARHAIHLRNWIAH